MITKNILIDSHCHLNFPGYDDGLEKIINLAIKNDVLEVWDIATDLESSKKSITIAKRFNNIKSFIGIDPEVFIPGSELSLSLDTDDSWFEQMFKELNLLIDENKDYVIGIGESGLDHYWLKDKTTHEQESSKLLQEKLFRMHLELAQKHKLPLSIHSRGAEEECLKIVKEYEAEGIFHSFTGNYETAKGILDSGWGLGVNGIITFKNANELREVYKKVLFGKELESPLDFYKEGIFFETDSPFLSPEGKRGEQNEPANVSDVYESFRAFTND